MIQSKILHLFYWDKKFVLSFIEFIRKNFWNGNHEFVIYGDVAINELPFLCDTCIYPSLLKKTPEIIVKLHKAKKIILHGLIQDDILYVLSLQPWVLRKRLVI